MREEERGDKEENEGGEERSRAGCVREADGARRVPTKYDTKRRDDCAQSDTSAITSWYCT